MSVLVLFIAMGFILYFSPYIALHNLFSALENNNTATVNKFINYKTVEENIFIRYQKNMFGDLKTSDLPEDKAVKKKIMEDAIRYGIDVLIEPDNVIVLLNALRLEKTPSGLNIVPIYEYKDFNTFSVKLSFDGKEQELIFKRTSFIIWQINDIIFPTDFNAIE